MSTRTPLYFDYLTHARAAGLNDQQIDALIGRWREDYGEDWNLLELRLLRVCKALADGRINYQEAIAPEPEGILGHRSRVAEESGPYGGEGENQE